jgi:hypothetical protein
MIVIDSGTRTLTRRGETLYVSSEEWGQPPASRHIIEMQARQGTDADSQSESIYVATGPAEVSVDPELEAEFAAWDIASDEALLNFEAELT